MTDRSRATTTRGAPMCSNRLARLSFMTPVEFSRLGEASLYFGVRVPGGEERWALGTCSMCEAGCGLRVRCIGKRAVRVQGDADPQKIVIGARSVHPEKVPFLLPANPNEK